MRYVFTRQKVRKTIKNRGEKVLKDRVMSKGSGSKI